MDIKVDIDAAAIERQLVKAITESAIGARIKQAISDAMKPTGFNYRSFVDDAVQAAVRDAVRDIVLQELNGESTAARVRALVQQKLTDEMFNEVIGKLFSR